jgi:hypothetical protein
MALPSLNKNLNSPNQTLETNRRPAGALDAEAKFKSAAHDPACLSGGGRSALRWDDEHWPARCQSGTAGSNQTKKGTSMRSPRSSLLRKSSLSVVCFVLSALGVMGPSPRSFGDARPEVLGEVAVQLEGYTQNGGSLWCVAILVTNLSKAEITCIATLYPARLAQGTRGVPTKDLKTNTLTKTLVWTRRQPEILVDPRLLESDPRLSETYGMGKFLLGPGEGRRLIFPLIVPQTPPTNFVDHLTFGYKRSSGTAGFKTYVAELREK